MSALQHRRIQELKRDRPAKKKTNSPDAIANQTIAITSRQH